ncbi:MAG TPA: hypothetical protein VKV02_04310 [Acidobacteriaceae bacterium]|nr:hypothetical protein [Acidobacteriaceae bacterium]
MLRPADFVRPCRTANIAPYQIIASPADLPERGSSNGGVFHRGQLVWTQESPAPVSVPHTAIGFVDGLGHVLIDRRILRPVEILAALNSN